MKSSKSSVAGDLIVVNPHKLGEHEQVGELLEVFGTNPAHYRVRWDDGHVSLFFPGSDVNVRRSRRPR